MHVNNIKEGHIFRHSITNSVYLKGVFSSISLDDFRVYNNDNFCSIDYVDCGKLNINVVTKAITDVDVNIVK